MQNKCLICHCESDLSGEAILNWLGLLRQFSPRNDKNRILFLQLVITKHSV